MSITVSLVGRLPLARPLLVAMGVHNLVLDSAGTLSPGRIEVQGGQGLEARLTADGTALQVRRLPTVFVASVQLVSHLSVGVV